MRKLLFVLLGACALAGQAYADENYATMGMGVASCQSFNAAVGSVRGSERRLLETAFFTWAQGVMSGMNIALAADGKPMINLNTMLVDDQQGLVTEYCRSNYKATYLDATLRLWVKLGGFKQ
jgi:hypothetical protein